MTKARSVFQLIQYVEQGKRETHVQNTQHDTHFHLERVGEDENVVGSVPGRIDSKGVPVVRLNTFDDVADLEVGRPAELGFGVVERKGENIVVHETSVHGKDLEKKVMSEGKG